MEFIVLGKVIKTRGLRGCLKVMSYAQNQDLFYGIRHIFLGKPTRETKEYQVKKIDISSGFLFLELDEISEIAAAASLVGCSIFLPRESLPKLPEGEYYWADIIGLDVIDHHDKFLGKIESIFPTGSNDVYICKSGKKEILLPAIADVIKKIDIEKGFIKVKLPKGL
ncbi:MAG: 16S rRNA processing protein RimM [Candidatus Aminicenantes bacterium]|nr:16S rRNA processing protein RimM [Candidatus Aminicenantes bacterium]